MEHANDAIGIELHKGEISVFTSCDFHEEFNRSRAVGVRVERRKKLPITLGIRIAVGVSIPACITSNANHDDVTGEGKCQQKGSR
jgi:uncharacterized alkaline shock family protein YloU